uniref:Uncharacterized protein n=1 Tax=Anguilla anguilla TaxID=7936 RepID=A0A0E9WRS4_ANGAN
MIHLFESWGLFGKFCGNLGPSSSGLAEGRLFLQHLLHWFTV